LAAQATNRLRAPSLAALAFPARVIASSSLSWRDPPKVGQTPVRQLEDVGFRAVNPLAKSMSGRRSPQGRWRRWSKRLAAGFIGSRAFVAENDEDARVGQTQSAIAALMLIEPNAWRSTPTPRPPFSRR
jgi:hypothetical protein